MNIAIVGAGIGGLATAILLERLGHRISLFEQFRKPVPIGSGLMIQPVGLEVLEQPLNPAVALEPFQFGKRGLRFE